MDFIVQFFYVFSNVTVIFLFFIIVLFCMTFTLNKIKQSSAQFSCAGPGTAAKQRHDYIVADRNKLKSIATRISAVKS